MGAIYQILQEEYAEKPHREQESDWMISELLKRKEIDPANFSDMVALAGELERRGEPELLEMFLQKYGKMESNNG